jgi:hypothetical protein
MGEKGNNNYKKKLVEKLISQVWEIVFLFILVILLYANYLTIERLIRFLVIFLIINIYIFIWNIVREWMEDWMKEKKEQIRKNEFSKGDKEELIKKINKLIKIFIWINPIIGSVFLLHKKLYYFFRWLNWKFSNYVWIRKLIYFIIMELITYPILLVHEFYYKILKRWKGLTFTELLFKRIEGLILSVVIFSNIINIMINFIKENELYWYIVIIVYILILILSLIKRFYSSTEVPIHERWGAIHIHFILNDKLLYTILGNVIENCIEVIKEYDNSNYEITFNLIIEKEKRNLDLILIKTLYEFKYINKEVKYKPSFEIYGELYANLGWKDSDLVNIYFYLKQTKNEESKKEIEKLYKKLKEKFKNNWFLIWEVEEYLKDKKRLEIRNLYYYDENSYFIGTNEEITDLTYNIKNFNLELNKEKFKEIGEDEGYRKQIGDLLVKSEREEEYKFYIKEREKEGISWPMDYDIWFNEYAKKEFLEFLEESKKEWELRNKIEGRNERGYYSEFYDEDFNKDVDPKMICNITNNNKFIEVNKGFFTKIPNYKLNNKICNGILNSNDIKEEPKFIVIIEEAIDKIIDFVEN